MVFARPGDEWDLSTRAEVDTGFETEQGRVDQMRARREVVQEEGYTAALEQCTFHHK